MDLIVVGQVLKIPNKDVQVNTNPGSVTGSNDGTNNEPIMELIMELI